MAQFKVTLRKNGRPVGEMCYGSEAVAVSKAAAMEKAAPGTAATVAAESAKSNRRRQVRRNSTSLPKNGTKLTDGNREGYELVMVKAGELAVGDRIIDAAQRFQTVTRLELGKTGVLLAHTGNPKGVYEHPSNAHIKAMPRRNSGHICRNPGCGCRANPRRNSSLRIPGQSADITKANAALALSPEQWRRMDSREAVALYYAVERALQDAYTQFGGGYAGRADMQRLSDDVHRYLKPLIDAHWKATSGSAAASEPKATKKKGVTVWDEVGFNSDGSMRLMVRTAGGRWQQAPHYKGESPSALAEQITRLAKEKAISMAQAALLRQEMRTLGHTHGAEAWLGTNFTSILRPPRKRKAKSNPRNGTWSAERMAALSQSAQFGRR